MSLLKLTMTFYTGCVPPHNTLASGKRPRGGFMDRRCPGFLLVLAIISLATLPGCVGKSTSNSGSTSVQTVTLNPSGDVSLELGKIQIFSATARNSAGQSVFATIHFVSNNNASLTISNS